MLRLNPTNETFKRHFALPRPLRFLIDPTSLSLLTLQLTTAEIENLVATLPTGHKKEDKEAEYIYVLALTEANRVPLGDLLAAFEYAREFQDSDEYDGKKNLCKANSPSEHSRALYVGRSYKPLDRLKQHLSESNSGTFAIHFAIWASELDIHVDFHLYRFSGLGNRVVQVLEDGLWDNLKPLLGTRGEK
jgi:hypothetical protein